MIIKKVRLTYLVVATAIMTFLGCDKVSQHDFDNLRDDVAKNTEEISNLKTLTASLQEAINSGQVITTIEDVSKVENGETIVGIKVTFSGKGGVKTIWNGSKGANGTNGSNGANGADGLKGSTPFVWINSNGNWATFSDKIPADKDNANYEIKDASGKSISGRGAKIEVVNQDGFIAFKVTDPNSATETITSTTIPFDPNARIVQSVVQNDFNVVFTIDNVNYSLMREISYPTSITMLQNTALVQKGKATSFNVKINPSNSFVTKEMLSIGYVSSMTRSNSVITNPDFVNLASCEAVDATNKESGEYKITLEWTKDIPKDDRALFIIASTKNNLGETIEVISSTPVYLTEEFVPIKTEYVSDFAAIAMFQGETYTDNITLTKDSDGSYIWNTGYIKSTEISINPTPNISATIDADNKFKFNIVADIVPAVTTPANFSSDIKITDLAMPAGSITKTIPVIVYPLVTTLIDKTDTPNNWIPIERKNKYVAIDFAQNLTDAGFNSDVWDIASASTNYSLDDVKLAIPSSIVVNEALIESSKSINVDILPEILPGVHKIQYIITATAKEGKRPASLDQVKTFTIDVTFIIKAPVFHIKLRDGIIGNNIQTSTETFGIIDRRGTYTTIVNKSVVADDIFQVTLCTNESNSYKTEYTIAYDSPSYSYAPGSGAQGLMFRTFPVVTNWNASTSVMVYSKLATGQEIPIYIGNYVLGSNPHISTAEVGIVDIVYLKRALDHVNTMPYKTQTEACFNYTTLQSTNFNINDEYTILGKDVTNFTLHNSCIAYVKYEVLDNVSTVAGMPKKLLKISEDGTVGAVLNHTWDVNVPVYQPIKIIMADIWGNEKSTIVEVILNSNSIPVRPKP